MHTHTHIHIHAHAHVLLPVVPYYPGSGLFHYGKSRLHFLRLPTTGVSNLENRVEGGLSNHVFLAIVSCVDPRHPRFSNGHPFIPAPACPHPWTQSSSRENEEPFIRWLVGATGTRLLYLSFSLFSSPFFFSLHLHVISFFFFFSFFLHHTDRPFTIRGRLFNRA